MSGPGSSSLPPRPAGVDPVLRPNPTQPALDQQTARQQANPQGSQTPGPTPDGGSPSQHDPAVTLSASFANLTKGAVITGLLLGQRTGGEPVLETPSGTFVIEPDLQGSAPSKALVTLLGKAEAASVEIITTTRQIEARVVTVNGARPDAPETTANSVIRLVLIKANDSHILPVLDLKDRGGPPPAPYVPSPLQTQAAAQTAMPEAPEPQLPLPFTASDPAPKARAPLGEEPPLPPRLLHVPAPDRPLARETATAAPSQPTRPAPGPVPLQMPNLPLPDGSVQVAHTPRTPAAPGIPTVVAPEAATAQPQAVVAAPTAPVSDAKQIQPPAPTPVQAQVAPPTQTIPLLTTSTDAPREAPAAGASAPVTARTVEVPAPAQPASSPGASAPVTPSVVKPEIATTPPFDRPLPGVLDPAPAPQSGTVARPEAAAPTSPTVPVPDRPQPVIVTLANPTVIPTAPEPMARVQTVQVVAEVLPPAMTDPQRAAATPFAPPPTRLLIPQGVVTLAEPLPLPPGTRIPLTLTLVSHAAPMGNADAGQLEAVFAPAAGALMRAMPLAPKTDAGAAPNVTPPQAGALPSLPARPAVDPEWPELGRALALLDPAAAAPLLARFPTPDRLLTPITLLFMTALGFRQPTRLMFGPDAADNLEKQDPEILRRLETEITRGLRQMPEQQGEWRSFQLPLRTQDGIHAIPLVVRQSGGDSTDRDKDPNSGKQEPEPRVTRFLLNLSLKSTGSLQFDGMIRDRSFNLILRSERALTEGAASHVRDLFRTALQVTGFAGDLAIKSEPFVTPPGFAPKGRAVTA